MNFKYKSKLTTLIVIVIAVLFSTGAMVVRFYVNTDSTNKPSPTVHYETVTSKNELKIADLYFSVKSAAVEVLPATDSKIFAQYDSEVYTVEIAEKETDKWTINISSKTGNNIGNNPIKLYLPEIDYGEVSLNIESASFDCEAIFSGNIVSTINTSSTHFILPVGFSGSFKADITDGYFELLSKDGYSDSNVTVSGNVNVPDYFTIDGIESTFSNGSKENIIEITTVGGYSKLE